jgi:beta propeller repeat protein
MRFRNLIALCIAAILNISVTLAPLAAGEVVAQTTTTTTIPMLPGTTIPIKVEYGTQTSPSVACNVVSYTNDDFEGSSTIRYLDFATGTEHVLPVNGFDRLSDTDGQRIAFTELGATGDRVAIYDIASQTTTFIPGNGNSDPALGGNLVAFRHGELAALAGDIEVFDRNTGLVTQLTNDTLADWHPAVSPDGKVVVWEKCPVNSNDCDIYSAIQTGPGAFTTRLLTGAGEDASPDTNGQIIVYTSRRNGENDIYFQRVGASTEMHLSIPGDQREPRISGNLIVFESQTATGYDVFVYDLATARLFQVTNTPDHDEQLSDIVTGCDGVNRIVYAVPGALGDFEVYGFTFQLSDSVIDQLNDLITLVRSFNLHDGTEASLITKLQDALAAVSGTNTPIACDSITAFINASQAQSGKKLTADQVKQLIDSATQIKSDLGCQVFARRVLVERLLAPEEQDVSSRTFLNSPALRRSAMCLGTSVYMPLRTDRGCVG